MYTSEIVAMLGRRFKDYRIGCDLTQKEVSERSGISVVTIRNFENGRMYNVTLGTFIELLRLEASSQPMGISEYDISKFLPEDFQSSLPTIEEIEAELGN